MFHRVICRNGRCCTLVKLALLCRCLCYSVHADTSNAEGCGKFNKNLKAATGKTFDRVLQPWIVNIFAHFHPWQQEAEGTFACSGSIISPRFVLTSAHCLTDGKCSPSLVQVYYNSTVAERGPYVGAKSVFYHPGLDNERWLNDIALILLEEPLRFDRYVMPVCLPKKGSARHVGDVASPEWGSKRDDDPHKMLYYSTSKIIPFSHCNKILARPNMRKTSWTRLLLCTRSDGNNFPTALSGGPLTLLSEGNSAVQVAIGSYTFCRRNYNPSAHTRVAPYVPWINKVLHYCAVWRRLRSASA